MERRMAVKLRQKNNDGKWWVMIHHKGQRSTRCLGRIDKRRAEHIRKEVETRLAMEDLGLLRSQSPTVAQYAADWVRIIEGRCKHATLTRYTSIVTMHILPHIGHLGI